MNVMHLTPAPSASQGMSIESQLTANLNTLKNEAFEISQRVLRTRKDKYNLLAKTYFWWLRATDNPEYLAKQYAQANIAVDTQKLKTDFGSVIKLIRSNQISEKDLNEWIKCLEAVHAEVKQSPDHYLVRNPVAAIAYWINTKGGISGLARSNTNTGKKKSTANSASNDEYFTLDRKEFNPCIFDEASKYHDSLQGLPTFAANDITTNEQGYGLALVKEDANTLVIVGSVNDPAIVENAIVDSYRSDFEAAPQTVRAVVEPLHVLNEPKAVFQHRSRFIEKSKVTDPSNEKGKSLAEKRLIFRPATGDFLLSQIGVDASPVVISKPHAPVIIGAKSDLFLPCGTRREVEAKLLNEKDCNLFKASNANQFEVLGTAHSASHTVTLDSKLPIDDSNGVSPELFKRHTHNLYHSALSFKPFRKFHEPTWQIVPNSNYFSKTWSCKANLKVIHFLNNKFFLTWLYKVGANAHRDKHNTFRLILDSNTFKIFHEKGDNGYDQSETIHITPGSATGVARLEVRSADLAFVLHQISTMKVRGQIVITASNTAIRITFQTSANSIDYWLPAVDTKGVRLPSQFARYAPKQIEELPPSDQNPDVFDPEDLGPDEESMFSQEELIAAITRLKNKKGDSK